MMATGHNSLRIVGGRLLDGLGGEYATTSLLIRDGQVVAVGEDADRAAADQVIDATGCVVSPGFVDLNCNLREPGNGQKGKIATETRAAAKGGYTRVCASPETSPVNDSGAVTHLIVDNAALDSPIQVSPLGALTRGLEGELLSDMAGLVAAGCAALSNGSRPVANARILRRCMAYAQTFGFTLMLTPLNQALAADGYAHEGRVATRLGLLGIPEVAETAAVMEMLLLAEDTGVRLHLSQLSTARSVAMVAEAQRRGVAVTADVAMQQLVFTEEALAGYDSRFHVRPPLRTEADRQALLAGVRDGVITAIVSAHQPHDSAAKQAPVGATEPGLSTIESVLSLGLKLVEAAELTLPQLVAGITTGPARVLGISNGLTAGAVADVCVFDPAARWSADETTLLSSGKHAPILQQPLPGVVRHTLCRGQVVWSAD
ncbi:dihydroorotase [Marinobacter sp. X15-166B]|uniref:dihydroorotase n=1 Tax=Marinobacter sp. X15-166B TaxID=1897620 RepID=UPI00085C09B6|nr:dihydroorotase [Marinobacter sp. X15-166B]OEY65849.1 dihydroorotase [Marinobacter sp. X15-166B]